MVISKFQNSFSALQAILRYPNSFLGTINDSGILHCTQTIKIINYSVIKCQKNGAKMNKIVQKWQFQKTFYTTMETVLGFSQNRLAELFQNYVFSTIQYLYFDLYVVECQIQFFWPASRFGVYVLNVYCTYLLFIRSCTMWKTRTQKSAPKKDRKIHYYQSDEKMLTCYFCFQF